MKYFYTLAALVALVAAQAELPECAVSCIRDATESETTCTFGDTACTCQEENRAAVTAAATPCVISACGVQVAIGQVQPATEAICAAAGEAPASSAAAPPASSAAAPPASSAAAPPASSAAAPPASSAAAPSGDDAYPLPSVVPTSAHSAVPSAAPSAAPSGNGTVTPPAEPPVEAGAAKAGFMGAAALAGFVALAL